MRSSLHPAPAFVLALAVGGSLAYLWHGPEASAHAAPPAPAPPAAVPDVPAPGAEPEASESLEDHEPPTDGPSAR